jgi:capsid protein
LTGLGRGLKALRRTEACEIRPMPARLASCLLAAAVAALPVATAPVLAADMLRDQSYSGVCSERGYLARIEHRFRYQVRHVPELPDVGIDDFYNIRETLYEPEDEKHPISRQYCEADVLLSDGQTHSIWYLIETDLGFASIGNNVEFCVDGFDRWYVYDGRCRVLRDPTGAS